MDSIIRVATVADARFRDRAQNLARSLDTSPNDYRLTIYCDQASNFLELRGPRCNIVELAEIKRLGAKRAKLTAFALALQEGSVIFLDADAIVLEDFDQLWGGTEIRGCADDLRYCPYIQDRSRPWPGDPALINLNYINSGGFYAPAERYSFFERLRAASLDDNIWTKYTLEPHLYDNHFLCAFLNLWNVPVTLLDPWVYGWRGFIRDGQLQVRRSGSHLLNKRSGKALKFVFFAGIQQTPERLRSLPVAVASLLFERIAGERVSPDDAWGNLYAALSPSLASPPADMFVNEILTRLLVEIRELAGVYNGQVDLRNRISYFTDPEAIKAIAFANPDPGASWNGLRCGNAYLDGQEYSQIRKMIGSLNIGKVFEVGAGETSILFRSLGVDTWSLEYQQGSWLERATQLGCVCLLVPFDNKERCFVDSQLEDQLTAHRLSDIDLLFIDSPVGTQNRQKTVSQLLRYLNPRFVLYHDALRDAVNIFQDQTRHGWKLIHFFASPRGLALFSVLPDAGGISLPDSFDAGTLISQPRAAITVIGPDSLVLEPGQQYFVRIRLNNASGSTLSSRYTNPVQVSYHWLSREGALVTWDGLRTRLPFDLEEGDWAEFQAEVSAPGKQGEYSLQMAVVQEGISWFENVSRQPPLDVTVEINPGNMAPRRTRTIPAQSSPRWKYASNDVHLIRNPDLVACPGAEYAFRIPLLPKFIQLAPRTYDVLQRFGTSAALVEELFPDAGPEIRQAIESLVELDALLRTDVTCLITGCARSGTMYASRLLSSAGLRIGHETMGKDGIASWLLAVDSDFVPWGPVRHCFQFKEILHQVRRPLAVISSMQTITPQSWQYMCHHVPCSVEEPLLLRCAKYWRYWNLRAESIATWRYRVEDIEKVWGSMCERLAMPADQPFPSAVPRDINTRKPAFSNVRWDDLLVLDRKLCFSIQEQAVRYGYPL